MTTVPAYLRRQVVARANRCCEYCLLPDGISFYPHEVDHIIAEKHGGETESGNLALACWRCNRHKGTDLTSIDPETDLITALFNPRTQRWNEHFRLDDTSISPLTPEARVTIQLLQLNRSDRLEERKILIGKGQYPPSNLHVSRS